MLMFYITAGSQEEAEKVAGFLVQEKLAACVNIIPRIKSFFSWENQVQAEEEILLMGKTRKELFAELLSAVKEKHSYEVPCVIAWEIKEGNPEFLDWIKEVTRQP